MPRRKPRIRGEFSMGSLVNLLAIPVITSVLGLVGWYYLTNDTLKRHDEAIKTIQVDARKSADDEKKEREKTRDAFMANQQKTTEILSKLDARLAVSETKQEIANQTLSKIADEISRLGAGPTIRR